MVSDYKKERDQFSAGPTRAQIEKADEFLRGRDLPAFLEKRNLAEDYRPALLRHQALDTPAEVMFGTHPVAGRDYHVVLARDELPRMGNATLELKRMGNTETLSGVLELSHRGKRAEDLQEGRPLLVMHFYRL